MDTAATPRRRLTIVNHPDVQAALQEHEALLAREEGIEPSFLAMNLDHHFKSPVEPEFTAEQRPHTTLLFGGLTYRHDRLIAGVLHSLGYKAEVLPTPNTDAFQAGKEYGNNGQCNPTYFTVGNLVQYLQHLRDDKGLSVEEIESNYVFVTAGSCGPCRFGMYEAEYRLALRNAGFEKFRVLLFQQTGGLNQGDVEAGLKMDIDFFTGMLNAANVGDLLNEVAAQIRPYEVTPGETDRVLSESLQYLYEVFLSHEPVALEGTVGDLLERLGKRSAGDTAVKFLDRLTSEDLTAACREVARQFGAIQVDRLRVKPLVKITGEFWAQTTDGDGNFNMFQFLQAEGAEILTEPVATWVAYLLWQAKVKAMDRRGIPEDGTDPKWWELGKRARLEAEYWKQRLVMGTADQIYRREYDRIREALGGTTHKIVDMWEMERLAHGFYHARSEGGEGHLEVGKNIYYTAKGIAHMVLSLKPFGCMPSTQSDGAQSAVVNRFKDMIFLPIETSGEGEINAHSRVQMALGEAKAKAKSEFAAVLEDCGYPLEDIRAYLAEHPEMSGALYRVPEYEGVTSTAARMVRHTTDRMRAE